MNYKESPTRIKTLAGFIAACLAANIVSTAQAGEHERDDGFAKRPNIKHVVIIFQENASFDHYFATYPDA